MILIASENPLLLSRPVIISITISNRAGYEVAKRPGRR